MDYSLQDLIAEWRMCRGLEPLRIDATIRRQDAFEIDEYARRDIERWYDRLLESAPLDLLVVEDITDRVTVAPAGRGTAVMQLPGDCRRLVEVMMKGWERPALITTADSKTGRRQVSPFSRGGMCVPVAIPEAGGRVRLYGFRNGLEPEAARVMAVARPPDGVYRCQPRALETLVNDQKLWNTTN